MSWKWRDWAPSFFRTKTWHEWVWNLFWCLAGTAFGAVFSVTYYAHTSAEETRQQFEQTRHEAQIQQDQTTVRWINAVLDDIDKNLENWTNPRFPIKIETPNDTAIWYSDPLEMESLRGFIGISHSLPQLRGPISDSALVLIKLSNTVNEIVRTRNAYTPTSGVVKIGFSEDLTFDKICDNMLIVTKSRYIQLSNHFTSRLQEVRESLTPAQS